MMHSLLVQTIIAYLLIFAVPMVLPFLFLKVVGLSGLRTLVTYEARDTPLHKLDPRLKVLYPVGMGILSILFTWKFMLIVFGLTILPWFWLKPSRAKIKVLIVMIIGPAIAGFWGRACTTCRLRPSTSSTSSRGRWRGSARRASPPTA